MAKQSPADRARQSSLKVLLEQSEGWKYVMELAFKQLQQYERQTNAAWQRDLRLTSVDKKRALLSFLEALYCDAGVESPFAKHYATLIAGFSPPPLPMETSHNTQAFEDLESMQETRGQQEARELLNRRRSSGSVA